MPINVYSKKMYGRSDHQQVKRPTTVQPDKSYWL